MSDLILITGGAGFIGQHLINKLLAEGSKIRVLDNFNSQIHSVAELPKHINDSVELIKADIRDRDAVKKSLKGVNKIVHLAAETGTGQSMYEIERYFSVNVQGTANILDLLQNDSCSENIQSLVVASSRAIYGEGAYNCLKHGTVYPKERIKARLIVGLFEPTCPQCESSIELIATSEEAPFMPMSFYALTKQIQEQAILMSARAKGINAFALRYQNVYGPGQSLRNPYTGILAIFSNLARQKHTIEVYEDGHESRDFVYIDDVVNATAKACGFNNSYIGALNIGSGQSTTVLSVAQEINTYFYNQTQIKITGAFRMGDIRHNIADISAAKQILDYVPKIEFKEGILNFLTWASEQANQDPSAYARSSAELAAKGLMMGR